MNHQWDKYNEERKRAKKKEESFPRCIDCFYIGRPIRQQKGYPLEGRIRKVLVYECSKHPRCVVTARSYGCEDHKQI